MQVLKEQRALQGISVDPKIVLEIEDITREVEKLQAELEEPEKSGVNANRQREVIGTIELDSPYYIERSVDQRIKDLITIPHSFITIMGSMQTGKSSLLMRSIHHTRLSGANVVRMDVQGGIRSECLNSFEVFTICLARLIVKGLWLDIDVEDVWRKTLAPARKLTLLMEDYILPQVDSLLVLALDEASLLLQTDFSTDFFGLLRYWYSSASFDDLWKKLNIIMTISSEPYLLISDPYQSPFNVAHPFRLEDFNVTQVNELNQQYGTPLEEKYFDQFMSLLNGHPYLTQKALYTLASRELNWSDMANILTDERGPFGEHLRFYYWLVSKDLDLRRTLEGILQHNFERNDTVFRLEEAGLIKRDRKTDKLTFRCNLYKMYFEDKLLR